MGILKESLDIYCGKDFQRIAIQRKGPWLMCGDFNEILNANEKRGGRVRENWSFVDFRNMVQNCKVSDLPFTGNNMTWMGKRKTHMVECWLDQTFANDEWRAKFPASEIEYLEMIESDHRPTIIKITRSTERGRRCFHFDSRLCNIPEIDAVVEQSWNHKAEGVAASVSDRIKGCRHNLSAWKKENNTNSAKEIKELTMAIDRLIPIRALLSTKYITCDHNCAKPIGMKKSIGRTKAGTNG